MTIDLQSFCRRNPTSAYYIINTPFNGAGHTYATDAHCVVRVQTTEPDSDPHMARPNCKALDWSRCTHADTPLPPLPAEYFSCWFCDGTGKESEDCPKCDGYGGNVDADGETHACPDCKGSGIVNTGPACEHCDGLGKNPPDIELVGLTGNWRLAGCYHRKLAALPNVRYRVFPDKYGPMIAFRFDGGEGLVMACEADRHS